MRVKLTVEKIVQQNLLSKRDGYSHKFQLLIKLEPHVGQLFNLINNNRVIMNICQFDCRSRHEVVHTFVKDDRG